jgi:hypothetical protein
MKNKSVRNFDKKYCFPEYFRRAGRSTGALLIFNLASVAGTNWRRILVRKRTAGLL